MEITDPGASVKLSGTLAPGGDVSGLFFLSPDGTQVLYRADQDTDDLFELYLVDVAAPGASTKLSDTMVPLGTVSPFGFAFSPDGSRVAYYADQDTNGTHELYLVDLATPGVSQKLSDTLVANGNVEHFEFSPDGTHVVYHADQDTDGVPELYLVDIATPQVSAKLNDALVAGGTTSAVFAFNSDGSQFMYRADQDTDELPELYLVDTNSPGVSMKVNESLVAGGEVSFNFGFTPDDAQILYGAEQDIDGVRELYLVDTSTPGASIKFSAPLVAGGMAATFQFSPDGTQVVYFADQDVDDVFEIYLADLDAPEVSVPVNGTMAAGGTGASNFIFLP